MAEYIYVKLIKEWGGFSIGDVVRFGGTKGQDRIANGEGVEVPKQNAVNASLWPKGKGPEAETATKEPEAEAAVRTPKKKTNKRRGR